LFGIAPSGFLLLTFMVVAVVVAPATVIT